MSDLTYLHIETSYIKQSMNKIQESITNNLPIDGGRQARATWPFLKRSLVAFLLPQKAKSLDGINILLPAAVKPDDFLILGVGVSTNFVKSIFKASTGWLSTAVNLEAARSEEVRPCCKV